MIAVAGEDVSVFDTLSDPAVRLAVWSRPSPPLGELFAQDHSFPASQRPELPAWLDDDLTRLAELYQSLVGLSARVRLETATARTCPGFHEDAVRLRFLVSYRGCGTEWTEDPEGGQVHRVPLGAVMALKGTRWPGPGPRILHRSGKASVKRPRWIMAIDACEAIAQTARAA